MDPIDLIFLVVLGVLGWRLENQVIDLKEKNSTLSQGYSYLSSAFKRPRTDFTFIAEDGTERHFEIREVEYFGQGQKQEGEPALSTSK